MMVGVDHGCCGKAMDDCDERLRGQQCAAKYPTEQTQANENQDEQKDSMSRLL
jgi:hypothetical protein